LHRSLKNRPIHRRSLLQIPIHAPSQQQIVILRRQPIPRPHHPQVLGCQDFAGFHVRGDVERAAEAGGGLFRLGGAVLHTPEGLPGTFGFGDQGGELVGLQREGGVHATVGAGPPTVILVSRWLGVGFLESAPWGLSEGFNGLLNRAQAGGAAQAAATV